MKISSPIMIKMTPPNMHALLDNLVPNFLPMISPAMLIKNVTTAMIKAQTSAIIKPYSAMVKPTDNASMEVAIP